MYAPSDAGGVPRCFDVQDSRDHVIMAALKDAWGVGAVCMLSTPYGVGLGASLLKE